jgi:serine protease Do
MLHHRLAFLSLSLLLLASPLQPQANAQTRQQKVLGDKLKFEANGSWFYNDLEKGFEAAERLKQPMLVVLRCIPCEECVKLDDDLIEVNPKLQQLLKSFVRVRVVGTNGLDLSQFQFDTDQSFAAFIFNADGTLYGRYGTRSDRTEWKDDVSVEGLGKALEAALEIHRNYPANQASLVGKQADKPMFATPEKIPSLATRFTNKLDYEGDTVKSCIHCHMIGEGLKANVRSEQGKIPNSLLFAYPHPKTIGLIMDPTQCATIKEVVLGSDGDKSEFRIGDRIVTLTGQPILSVADFQWVLHHAPDEGGTIKAVIERNGQRVELPLTLSANWRSQEDIAWRASSWSLRQVGLGGMLLKPATKEERLELGVKDGQMALLVQHVGAYAPHDRAKKAGIQKGDAIVEYDGRTDLLRETDLLAYAINAVEIGKNVAIRIRRGAESQTVQVATSR